jgi:hypothetical protein
LRKHGIVTSSSVFRFWWTLVAIAVNSLISARRLQLKNIRAVLDPTIADLAGIFDVSRLSTSGWERIPRLNQTRSHALRR